MWGNPLRSELFPLFVECGQRIHGARSAGVDQSFSTDRSHLTHEDRDVLVVEFEDAWCCLKAVPEADTKVSVDMDPETLYNTLGHIKVGKIVRDRLQQVADVTHPRRTKGMKGT